VNKAKPQSWGFVHGYPFLASTKQKGIGKFILPACQRNIFQSLKLLNDCAMP